MQRRIVAVLGLLGPMLALAGCVSLKRTPEARFFALRPTAEPAPAARAGGNVGEVGVLAVRIPRHLQRPQLVVWRSPSELAIDEFVRWAEPLDVALQQVLADDLAAELPDHRVVRRPWPARTELLCRVLVELSAFGMQESREVQLEGRWALLPADRELPLESRAVALSRGPLPAGTAADPGATVEILNQLVDELAQQIATAIRELPPQTSPEPEPTHPPADAAAGPAAPGADR
jgi:uncharacterized lipoprotein YmbA